MSTVDFEDYDLRVVSLHEAGHAILAERYGILSWAHIWRVGGATIDERSWAGQCKMQPWETTPFRVAVICFGGLAAERAGEFNFDPEALAVSICDAVGAPDEYSDTDRAGIRGTKQVWRAAKVASRFIASNWGRLLEIAEALRSAEWYHSPLLGGAR